jgi:DNA-3-methyladenine glycosylase
MRRASGEILPRSFYSRPTIKVAKDLLGKVLRHGETAGIIVETEAYLGEDDMAAHSSRGLTDKTKVIFGAPGHAYVYLIYGVHECLNLIAEPEGKPGCVLIRAIEPTAEIEVMQKRRAAARKLTDLTSGPGKLTIAMGIGRRHNGADVTHGPITVHEPEKKARVDIVTTARIGITKCADWPLRFYVADNVYVSGPSVRRREDH